jgi:hypothetical protein
MIDGMTVKELDRLLQRLGFVGRRPATTHLLYTRPGSEVRLLLPPWAPSEIVDPVHAVVIERTLTNHGVIESTELRRIADEVRRESLRREPAVAATGHD